MDAILMGLLAVVAIIFGGMFTLGKYRLIGIFCGIADVLLSVLSACRFKVLLVSSGKVLTPELLGFGYNKQVLLVYVIMSAIGVLYVLIGIYGTIREKSLKRAKI